MLLMTAPAPLKPIGYAQAPNYNWWLYEDEPTPELQWPQSISVYDAMRKQDSQVASVLRAVSDPVRRTGWRIDPNGARDEVVDLVSDDLGLPIVGQAPKPAPRSKGKFSFSEHLRLSLLMLPMGHAFFEQLYRVDDDGVRAHLAKLELRPSKTIERIEVATDGGLVYIKQYWTALNTEPKPIPVDRLVAYVYDREGGNWLGTSVLRRCYKNWLIKDRLLRVQAQTIERNGMGVPRYTAAETETELTTGLGMATSWRAGEAAGAAIPFGAHLDLVGVEGTLPDADPAIRYHDEAIARAVLAHFLNLGTQTGSWALGTTFADFFTLSLQTLAQQIADTVTQHVIEDLVDANWGPSESAPRLVFDEIGSRQAATAAAIKTLVDAGVIRPDQVLEESSRQQYGLPPADSSTERTAPAGGEVGPKAPASPEAPDPSVRPGSVAASYEQAALDDEWDAWDEATDALTHVLAAFDESKHLRNPKGHEGGGRFRSMVDRLTDALTQHHKGGGKGDPFEGFDREQLRRVAVKRGVKLKRGASRDEISHALSGDLGKGHVDKPHADAPDKPAPKAPAATGGAALVAKINATPIVGKPRRFGGTMGVTTLEEHEGGLLVRKSASADQIDDEYDRDPMDSPDAEELATLVGEAVGVRTPAILRTSSTEILMEHIDGKVGADIISFGQKPPAELLHSDSGRLLGLLDVIVLNADRNEGNWIVDGNGDIAGIDHAESFNSPDAGPRTGSPFAAPFIDVARNGFGENDMSPGDMATIRARLVVLRPEFERTGHGDWFDAMMTRFDVLAENATGTRSRLGDRGPA